MRRKEADRRAEATCLEQLAKDGVQNQEVPQQQDHGAGPTAGPALLSKCRQTLLIGFYCWRSDTRCGECRRAVGRLRRGPEWPAKIENSGSRPFKTLRPVYQDRSSGWASEARSVGKRVDHGRLHSASAGSRGVPAVLPLARRLKAMDSHFRGLYWPAVVVAPAGRPGCLLRALEPAGIGA